ncbi:MAG: ArsR family transcriptional regulator [Pyrinomonadaceae bacterium]
MRWRRLRRHWASGQGRDRRVLPKASTCICGDIVDELPLAQATISQHLKELKQAGPIKGNIDGNAICYCIDERTVQRITDYLASIAARSKNSKCCCRCC